MEASILSKKIVKGLGIGYEKIDVCRNDCMFFYKIFATVVIESYRIDSNIDDHPIVIDLVIIHS